METKRESVNTKNFKVIGHQFIISEKLKNSIENRTYESEAKINNEFFRGKKE